mgnify:CR=1 FL=1
MKPDLSLVIPAYNEEKRLERSLTGAVEYLSENEYSYEVIVVDDGSRDKTAEVAENFNGENLEVRRGMLAAKGYKRIFSDADFSTPIYELPKILNSLNIGFDVCIGSRAVDFSMIKEHQPFYREFMGKTFNRIVQTLVIKGVKDTQCGFKGFTDRAAEDLFSKAKINGFGFDVEILYLANLHGFKVDEVSVEWYNDDRSTVNPIVDSTKMLLEIFRVRSLHKNHKP